MSGRTRRVPEVLQSSLMDCGPAALQAVLRGFGIHASYETIRSRCRTDVDGTSIYELARLAGELGLASSQVLVPRDTLLLPSADCLPAVVVTSESAGVLHFVVVWRTLGPLVEIMDPNTGRRWLHRRRLLATLPDVPVPISVARFARWRKTSYARDPLIARLSALGVPVVHARALVEPACRDSDHRPYATLDAATRMVATLVESGVVSRGREAARMHAALLERADTEGIPVSFWWVSASETPGMLTVRGAPIVHFRKDAGSAGPAKPSVAPAASPAPKHVEVRSTGSALTAPLAATREAGEQPSLRLFLGMLRVDLPRAPYLLLLAVLASAAVAIADVLTLSGLLHAARHLVLPEQRVLGVLGLVALCAGGLALDWASAGIVARVGRTLELRMRGALFERLPQLPDAYLRTRSTADMAQRGHALHLLHLVPETARRALEAAATLTVSTAAIAVLFPESAAWALAAAGTTLLVPFAFSRAAADRVLRARTHMVALDRFYLDALVGVVPIRVHGAERAVRREHEALLTEWARATTSVHAQTTVVQALSALVACAFTVLLAAAYGDSGRPLSGLLLLVFWAWRIPAAGRAYVDSLVTYRSLQHAAVRFFAPLSAQLPPATPPQDVAACGAAAIELRGVSVRAESRPLLSEVELRLAPGQHVAVVGPSGAGKSTLVGLLLGFQAPTVGTLRVDGAPLDADALARLRARTVWVDPSVQIWNDTLIHNVLYGADAGGVARLAQAMDLSELTEVLETLPEGLQAVLGEAGARVSGGQGQRVRIARSLVREAPRLVVLDEPFRGLERTLRRRLLDRLRACFREATLLFVSHDVRDTDGFDRVLVLEGGKVTEDASPAELLARPESRYRALVQADAEQRERSWSVHAWKRARISGGRLEEGS